MAELIENLTDMEEDTQKGKYLTFTLGREIFGIEIRHVTEIIGIQAITEVPELPEYIKGIINLRGKIIPVMDVRLRFRKDPVDYNDRTCIVVIDIQYVTVGLIVDGVAEVVTIPDEDIVPPPEVSKRSTNRYIRGIGKVAGSVMLLLDSDRLLNDEEAEMIEDLEIPS